MHSIEPTLLIDLAASPAGATARPGDAATVPEPTEGPGDGVVVAFSLPGGDGEAFIDVLSLLTDAPRMDDADAADHPLRLAVVPWDRNVARSVARLADGHARVRALTLGPLDLRAGAAAEHATEVAGVMRVSGPHDLDVTRVDWDRVERLHCQAHRARLAWYDVVDRAGIATVDLLTEHWHDAPLEVATLVARWLGLDVTLPVDDGALALLAGGRSPWESELCTVATQRIRCGECDASAVSADRLTLLETWALNGAVGEEA